MADQLTLYNGALLLAGERFLGSLTENREPRRLLDHLWSKGAVNYCLEQGQWNFAMRTIQIDYDSSIEPQFGYNRAFVKPTDWVLTSALCTDEFFRVPQTRYVDEAGYWYSDVDMLFVRYVSNDPGYGTNYGRWPESFAEYVEAYLASRIILKLSNDQNEEIKLDKLTETRLVKARNRCALSGPTQFVARGAWSNARNRFPNRRDGGNTTGSMIG